MDPVSYSEVAYCFAESLKKKSEDFYPMLAGFDAAAPQQPPDHFDEEAFLKAMKTAFLEEDFQRLVENLGGWASHAYPNHGYVGSPYGRGRTSLRGYEWELFILKTLGIEKNLPVFITETGWPHVEGIEPQGGYFDADEVAYNFKEAFYFWKLDHRLMAVTPFILNYQGEPFDHFSWQRLGEESGFYSQYETVKAMKKITGRPIREERLKLVVPLPGKLIQNSAYLIPMEIKNDGQSIWEAKDGYSLSIDPEDENLQISLPAIPRLKPFEEGTLLVGLTTGEKTGDYGLNLSLKKDQLAVGNQVNWPLSVVPTVTIDFKVGLFPFLKADAENLELLIRNAYGGLVGKKPVEIKNGRGRAAEVKNVIIGGQYELVLRKKGYLPVHKRIILTEGDNQVDFGTMWPLDFNGDGRFSLIDFWSVF